MPSRVVTVGDDLTLPPSVRVPADQVDDLNATITDLATRNGGGVPKIFYFVGEGQPEGMADGDFVIKPL